MPDGRVARRLCVSCYVANVTQTFHNFGRLTTKTRPPSEVTRNAKAPPRAALLRMTTKIPSSVRPSVLPCLLWRIIQLAIIRALKEHYLSKR